LGEGLLGERRVLLSHLFVYSERALDVPLYNLELSFGFLVVKDLLD